MVKEFGTQLVHRQVWIMANGPIPEGMNVCHHCDNPACYRLDHLFLGTQKDNAQDCVAKGRHLSQKRTSCINGHEYNEANTYINARGYRRCRVCRNAGKRRRRN